MVIESALGLLLCRDAVALDVLAVQFPAESGSARKLDPARSERRTVRNEVPPDRIAVRVEALDEGSVGDRCEKMGCDLRLLVMTHCDVEDMSEGCDPPPFRRAAGP